MSKKNLLERIQSFQKKTIGVVGDLMLDQFIWGEVHRISPEAPVPVVNVQKETFLPGGAGNVAANVSALGGKVQVVGMVGSDEAGAELLGALKRVGVSTQNVKRISKRITSQKCRVVAGGQHVVRIDRETISYIDKRTEKMFLRSVADAMSTWDGVILSDYAKGFFTKTLAQAIIGLARRKKKPIIVDAKPKHALFFRGATLIAPNAHEALAMSHESNIKSAGLQIQRQLKSKVLITEGGNGMTLFEGNRTTHFPAQGQEVFDVTGAGDTVMAAFMLGLVSGATLKEAAHIGNVAAGIVVGKLGTACVSGKELRDALLRQR